VSEAFVATEFIEIF